MVSNLTLILDIDLLKQTKDVKDKRKLGTVGT